MKILENKAICIVLALALVIAGFIIGGCRSLNSLYSSKVEKVFMTGEDGDGICIENDLAERETAAVNLCTIASKYDGTKKQADGVREAAAELSSASSVADKLEANKNLDTAVESLFNDLLGQHLSASDEKYARSFYTDFNSRNDTISHDPYNRYAAQYNEIIAGFPASLLPVKEAVIFY